MRRAIYIFISVMLVLTSGASVFAKDIGFEAAVERNRMAVGESFQLNLTFNGTQNMPALELPEMGGFKSRYLGPSTSMSIVNGQVSSSITHVYNLLALKAGTFKLGPFHFEYNGDKYASNEITIEVSQGQPQPQAGAQPQAQGSINEQDLSDRVFLIIQAKKNKAYLNEVTPLTIKLYVNRLGIRDIQYPEFGHEGFFIGEFEKPRQYQEALGGVNYDVIEFNTYVFGLRPGEFRLGPANLKCNLIVKKQGRRGPSGGDFFDSDIFDDFFSRYETYPLNLKSTDIPITVLALPEEGRPSDYSGALGDFDLEAAAGPSEVKVGDPITLRVVVRGDGNFNTVNMPKLSSDKGFKVYDPQVKQEKGQKTFEQILMPLSADIAEVPALSFSFFNTRTGEYQTITKGPFPIKVSKPEKEEALKIIEQPQAAGPAVKEETLGRDIIYIKDSMGRLRKKGGFLYKDLMFRWLQLLPALCFLSLFAAQTRRRRLATDIRYARQLRAPKKAKIGMAKARGLLLKQEAGGFYNAIFETLQEYLGDRFHLPSKGITASIIDDNLKHKAVPDGVLNKLADVFRECDIARYAASEFRGEAMEGTLKKLEEAIDYFQRNKLR